MVLGAVWCPRVITRQVNEDIRNIKKKYGLSPDLEVKWVKVSPGRLDFYTELANYFFENDDLHFRGVVIPDKGVLKHEAFGQEHDDWYYKMFFLLLTVIIAPRHNYNIYLDIKDTRSRQKLSRLEDVLANAKCDFDREIINKIQHVRSHEVELIQLADLLIGAVMYANRSRFTSDAKKNLVEIIKARSGYSLTRSTLLKEDKFNILRWRPAEV
jgi:predicted nucleic acid-binding protein